MNNGVIDVTPPEHSIRWGNLKRILGEFDTVLERIAQIGNVWEADSPGFRTRGPHKQAQRVMLRGPWPLTVRNLLDWPMRAVRYPAVEGLAMDIFIEDELAELVCRPQGIECPPLPERVLLAKLPPGGAIEPHIDEGEFFNHTQRYHIPLKTNPRALLFVDDVDYQLQEGRVYLIRNDLMHYAVNEGDTDRIHLIFDMMRGDHLYED